MYQTNAISQQFSTNVAKPTSQNNCQRPQKKSEHKINVPALAGSILGVIVPMLYLKKK